MDFVLNMLIKKVTLKLGSHLKFIYFVKATKFCEIFPLLLSYFVPVKG